MSDEILLTILYCTIPVCIIVSSFYSKDLSNPVILIAVTFFLPMLFCLKRLSGLQLESWSDEMYVLSIMFVIAWLIFLTGLFILSPPNTIKRMPPQQFFVINRGIILFYSTVIILSFLLANIIQSGSPLPILHPEVVYAIHHKYPAGLVILAKATPIALGFLLPLYYYSKHRIDLFFIVIIFIIPLTRAARIDVFIHLVMVCVFYISVNKVSFSKLILSKFSFALLSLIGGLAVLGNMRMNRFGQYSVSYANAIDWKGIEDPTEILPILYGYFPLSFENANNIVMNNSPSINKIPLVLDWLYVGILKVHFVFSDYYDFIGERVFIPLDGAALVETAMPSFYLAFGSLFAVIPLSILSFLWFVLYKKRNSSAFLYAFYLVFSGAIALSSFQSYLTSAVFGSYLVNLVLVMLLVSLNKTIVRRRN